MQDVPLRTPTANPLINFIRQPKIFIKLPSNGKYWPEGSLKVQDNEEYPVYSMTAKDELLLKTPDALLNGQAVVDVIQSCIPNVLNGWQIPQIDIDALLIAIRIASYGETIETQVKIKDLDAVYPVDLRTVLDLIYQNVNWNERVEISDEMIIFVRPLSYKQMSKLSTETFETQRIINIVNNDKISEEEKVSTFQKSFSKLTEIAIDMVSESIYRIDTPQGSVTDSRFIAEFIQNCDRKIFSKIREHIDHLRESNSLKPMKVAATQEMIDAGSDPEIEVPLLFDPTNFFG